MGKNKKKLKHEDDTPIFAPPPSTTSRGFACPRCQQDIGSAANLPAHQLDDHILPR